MKSIKKFDERETLALIRKVFSERDGSLVSKIRFNVSPGEDVVGRPTGCYNVELEVEFEELFPLEIRE